MQRTRRTSLNPSESSHSSGDAQEHSEPAGLEPAGSASSPDSATGTPATPEDVDATEAAAGPVKPRSHPRLVGLFAVVGVLVLGLDQLTKALALQHLTPGDPVNVIGELLKFNLIRNPGAAFSLGSDFTPVISTIQIAVALGVIWLSRRLGSVGWAVAFGLLFGGAVGNITDMAVTSAAILLVIQTLRGIKLDGTKDVSAK
jgi:signal peptidase II